VLVGGGSFYFYPFHPPTPLEFEIGKEMVELLLTNGADVNAANNGGAAPLHTAAFFNFTEVVELLLARGADINAKDKNGRTALRQHGATE
jgi:ankyrin repeat protein